MAGPDNKRTDGAPPTQVHIEKKKTNWLAWLLLALGVLALLLALARCNRGDTVTAVLTPAPAPARSDVVAVTPNAGTSAALAGTSGLGTYLASTAAAPRTFQFEKINFDTAKSDVRAADAAEVTDVAGLLIKYPNTKIKIAGYADARGNDTANVALGKARAESVKAALVGKGINEGRIETVSGGTSDPVATNGTALGQAENRRTELVVTQR